MEYAAIFAKEQKDVPHWMKSHHDWQSAVDVNKLPKLELRVKMCCLKCEEKVEEEIREVHGVFDVKVDRANDKVIVVGTPAGPDRSEVLKRAKKIHRKAKFVESASKSDSKPVDSKPKEEETKTATTTTVYVASPLVWGHFPVQVTPPAEYKPSQSYPARRYNPNYPSKEFSDGPFTYFHTQGYY